MLRRLSELDRFQKAGLALIFLTFIAFAIILFIHYSMMDRIRFWYNGYDPMALAPVDGREPVDVDFSEGESVWSVLAFGQSNSANFGSKKRIAKEGVYNFYEGQLYDARDPMLGAGWSGGSVWPRLGDFLLERRDCDKVIFTTIGIGSASVSQWAPGGDLHDYLMKTVEELKLAELQPTHILWIQGETDALRETSRDDYYDTFVAMKDEIRKAGIYAPFYITLSTACFDAEPNDEIRSAQLHLIQHFEDIHFALDTDELGEEFRHDGCHYNDKGMNVIAEALADVLNPISH